MSEDEEREKHRQAGFKAAASKTPEQMKKAGEDASKRRKFFEEFRNIAKSLDSDEETNYKKIKKHFEDNVSWDWSEDYLRPQVYDATVNDMLRTSRWTKTPESQFNVFFAVSGDRQRLVAYDPDKWGHWRLSRVGGKLTVVQSEDDPVKFEIAGGHDGDASFESLRATMLDFKTHMRANYLPVTARFLIKNYPDECAWDDISKEIERLNNFYEPTKTTRLKTAMEMVAEQQSRKKFFGITCFDKNGDQTKGPTKVSKCSLLGNQTKEQLDELKEICGRLIAFHHCREMT